tara:strand:- start:112 stop:351 length:240 start_codon:yes stop_codon:yes gene_type:complete
MFSSNKNSEFEMNQEISKEINLDKLTLWLIRLACIFIIIFFSAILLALPILLSLIKTQYINFSLGIKDLIKSFIEIYLT